MEFKAVIWKPQTDGVIITEIVQRICLWRSYMFWDLLLSKQWDPYLPCPAGAGILSSDIYSAVTSDLAKLPIAGAVPSLLQDLSGRGVCVCVCFSSIRVCVQLTMEQKTGTAPLVSLNVLPLPWVCLACRAATCAEWSHSPLFLAGGTIQESNCTRNHGLPQLRVLCSNCALCIPRFQFQCTGFFLFSFPSIFIHFTLNQGLNKVL